MITEEVGGMVSADVSGRPYDDIVGDHGRSRRDTIVGRIASGTAPDDASEAARDAGDSTGGRPEFRERHAGTIRMSVAHEAEQRFGRKVSWGVEVGDRRALSPTSRLR
jgi:hypothetical protein